MVEISGMPVPMGDKNHPGPTLAQFKLTGYSGDSEGGIFLSPQLATPKEVDEAMQHLVKAVEKAGKEAKRILVRAKEDKK